LTILRLTDFSHYSGKSNFQESVQAAKDGFRIMRVPVSSPFVSFVMERYDDANGPYSYKLFEAALSPKTAKELNKSTKGAFRLMPSTFVFQPHQNRVFAISDTMFAILEKPPVPIQCEYIAKEYRLMKGKQDDIDKLAALGYKMVESLCDDRFLFEKTGEEPDIYSYKLLSVKSLGALSDMRKEGYSISLRFVCGRLLVMEKPASRSGSFDYEVDEPLDAHQL